MGILNLLPVSRHLVNRIHPDDPLPVFCVSQEQSDQLSEPTSLERLCEEFEAREQRSKNLMQSNHVYIVWIEACLRNPTGISPFESNVDFAANIRKWVLDAIIPPEVFAKNSPFDPSELFSLRMKLSPKHKQILTKRLRHQKQQDSSSWP